MMKKNNEKIMKIEEREEFIDDMNCLYKEMRVMGSVLKEHKPFLLAAIIIGLKDDNFRKNYKEYQEKERLGKELLKSVYSSFEKAGLSNKELDNTKQLFSFIGLDPKLNDKEVLYYFVDKIEKNYDKIIEQYNEIDLIGNFYGHFSNYVNKNRNSLGIVLTPKHITELFCDIADVNKDSIVLDTCQGTGSFLVAARNRIIKDLNGEKMKKNQLIGCELQPNMFVLGASNMIIKNDNNEQKTIMGSCFDNVDILKKYKPNVGFINPPYSQRGNKTEMHFILNMAEIIQPGGTIVAIVPISVASNMKNKNKDKLLKNNTLEAVLTMNNDLFYPVTVSTCIMKIKVGVPHPEDYETFFGYFKDDGFISVQNRGRIDNEYKYEFEIKDKWLNLINNREEKDGISLLKHVNYDDEWLAEAYIKTNYSDLSKEDFELEVRKYMSYLIMNDLVGDDDDENIE